MTSPERQRAPRKRGAAGPTQAAQTGRGVKGRLRPGARRRATTGSWNDRKRLAVSTPGDRLAADPVSNTAGYRQEWMRVIGRAGVRSRPGA